MKLGEITTEAIHESKVIHYNATNDDGSMTPKKFIALLSDPRSELYKQLYTIALEKSVEKAHDIFEQNQYFIAQANEKKRDQAKLKAKILANIEADEAFQLALDEQTQEAAIEKTHPLYQLIPHELVNQLLVHATAWEHAEIALAKLNLREQTLEDEKQLYSKQLTERLTAMPLLTLPKGSFNNGDTTFTLASDLTAVNAIEEMLSKRLLPTEVVLNHLPEGHPVHDLFMQTVKQLLDGDTNHECLIRAHQSARDHLKLIPRNVTIEMAAMIPLIKAALIAAHGPNALDALRTAYATDDGQPYGRPPNVIKILEDKIKQRLGLDSRETQLTRMDDAHIRNSVERHHHTTISTKAKNTVETILLDIIDGNPDVSAEFEKIRQRLFPADSLNEQEHRVILRK